MIEIGGNLLAAIIVVSISAAVAVNNWSKNRYGAAEPETAKPEE